MGGRDKLGAELAGRSVLRRSVEALARGRRRADRDRHRRRPAWPRSPPRRGCRTRSWPWSPAASRRQESVAAGVAARPSRGGRVPGAADARGAAADPVILVHDAARPLVSPALVRAVADAAARTGPPSRCCRSPRRSSGSTAISSARPSTGRTSSRPRRRRASGAACSSGPTPAPARRPRDLDRRGLAAGGL